MTKDEVTFHLSDGEVSNRSPSPVCWLLALLGPAAVRVKAAESSQVSWRVSRGR